MARTKSPGGPSITLRHRSTEGPPETSDFVELGWPVVEPSTAFLPNLAWLPFASACGRFLTSHRRPARKLIGTVCPLSLITEQVNANGNYDVPVNDPDAATLRSPFAPHRKFRTCPSLYQPPVPACSIRQVELQLSMSRLKSPSKTVTPYKRDSALRRNSIDSPQGGGSK
jgi:hypothetical protein